MPAGMAEHATRRWWRVVIAGASCEGVLRSDTMTIHYPLDIDSRCKIVQISKASHVRSNKAALVPFEMHVTQFNLVKLDTTS